jgi:RNA polymerase sigma-70 factor (ECF subfamily)
MALMAAVAAIDGPDECRDAVAAARSGDLGAFELLMRQHERLVLATALRLTGNMADAQDISQEVFLRLYKNLSKVQAANALPAWLYRVTVNACHDLRRHKPLSEPVEMAGELVASGTDPQASLTQAERRRVLEMSLRILPEKERAALVLRDLEGLTTEEVARALGSSEATVRSQVSKARAKVHDFVERYFSPRGRRQS